jgi:hypothetical protein
MRAHLRSLLTLLSTLLLLLTSFLILHSLHHLDTWSCESTSDGSPISTAYLDISPSRLCFNFWLHEDDAPDDLTTTIDRTTYPSHSPTLRDGRNFTSFAGLAFSHGARASTHHSYLGLQIPSAIPLLLFSILPATAIITSLRRRSPPRLLHHFITTLSVASTALAILLSITWIKSFHHDHIAVPDKFFSENHAWLLSSRGITYWYFFDEPLQLRKPKWLRTLPDQGSYLLAGTMDPASRFLGFGRTKSTYMHSSLWSGRPSPRPYTILAIPYYALLAATLMFPLIILTLRTRRFFRHLRKSKGQCPHCGYDLRATPDHCPECGATIAIPISPPRAPASSHLLLPVLIFL